MSNQLLKRYYPEANYGGYSDIDGTIAFFMRIRSLLKPHQVLLDVGCGRGSFRDDPVDIRREIRIFQGAVARVIGIDIDTTAKTHPYLDEFILLRSDVWPIASNTIDIAICDNVLEHVADPGQLFKELKRVLKPGGILCLRTPNRWNYVALVASLVPNKFHARITAFAQEGRENQDVFPTLYRCNSPGKIKKVLIKNNFDCIVYGHESEPGYLSFSKIAYFFGVLHQRYAPRMLKSSLFAFATLKS